MIILMGKTCSGKSTIKNELVKLGFSPVTAYTTRPPRAGESDTDYHFIDDKLFSKMCDNNEFLEHASYKVADGSIWRYGTKTSDYTDNSVAIIAPRNLTKVWSKCDNCVTFYLKCNDDIIVKRLLDRGDNIVEAERRLADDNQSFDFIPHICNFTISTDVGITPVGIAKNIINLYKGVLNEA